MTPGVDRSECALCNCSSLPKAKAAGRQGLQGRYTFPLLACSFYSRMCTREPLVFPTLNILSSRVPHGPWAHQGRVEVDPYSPDDHGPTQE